MKHYKLKEKIAANGGIVFDTHKEDGRLLYTAIMCEGRMEYSTCFDVSIEWIQHNVDRIANVRLSGDKISHTNSKAICCGTSSKFGRTCHIVGISPEYVKAAKELGWDVEIKEYALISPSGNVVEEGYCLFSNNTDPNMTHHVEGLLPDLVTSLYRYLVCFAAAPMLICKAFASMSKDGKPMSESEMEANAMNLHRMILLLAKTFRTLWESGVPMLVEEWKEDPIDN